ncbi:MAG: energy transducer TonB, partial [Gammaproteobacteria bacterium]|nr:energy transducer TonB [Gammaproteobacteria bacterium]
APAYPEAARRFDAEGWVDLDFVVDTDGRTRDITVLDSRPGDRFDEAAVEAVRQQRYEPFELDGRRYARRLQLRIRFTLD